MNADNRPSTAMDAVKGCDLAGKVFLVTGAYSGLGAAATRALLAAGGRVIATGRNEASLRAFEKKLTTQDLGAGSPASPDQVDGSHVLDLGSLASVRDFAASVRSRYDRLDCLINNAGVMNTPAGQTTDGFEIQMGTNVIGHFLLAKLLAETTQRQVWLSSAGHSLTAGYPGPHGLAEAPRIDLEAIRNVDPASYDGWRRYQQSKLGDILLAKQFPLEYPHLKACSVHPGVVRTNLGRHLSVWTIVKFLFSALRDGPMLSTPEQGARTQTLCAVMPDEELVNGAYYADAAVAAEADAAKNMEDARRLYDYCDDATKAFQASR